MSPVSYTHLDVYKRQGYPNIAVTAVTAVTRPPCKGNLPAVFPAAVLVADTVLASKCGVIFIQPFRNHRGYGFRFPHRDVYKRQA